MEAESVARGAGQRAPVLSAACSSANVPTTLVWMNCAGPSIERSTWLSAARCMTTSGRKLRTTSRILPRVDDVRSNEDVSAECRRHGREVVEIAGIGQLVEDEHLVRRRR